MLDTLPTDTTPGLGRRAVLGGATALAVTAALPAFPAPAGDDPARHRLSADALRGSFSWYRALDATMTQNEQRKNRRLTLPVLAAGASGQPR